MPGPADIPYPPGQKHLYANVKQRGCVVGTAHEREPAHGHTRAVHPPSPVQDRKDPLLERNRLIAELAQVMVLVEATKGAAAIHTIETALDMGKQVGAVPGRITEESAEGPNRLIA